MKIKWHQPLDQLVKDKSFRLYGAGFLIIIALCWFSQARSHDPQARTQNPDSEMIDSPDTVIPKGFVLVPLDLQNADSLGSMMDQFAIVDLYMGSAPGAHESSFGARLGSSRKVGSHLRLIRAPLNPKTFAVLVPEAQAPHLVSASGSLFAVIQNSKLKGQGQLEQTPIHENHVKYYSGN